MTLATAALFTLPPASLVFAQDIASPAGTAQSPQAIGPFVAIVTGNAVNVRSGPSAQSAYAFGKLNSGDAVQVIAEEFGWARVRTVGTAFGSLYAYVPADRRVTLATDGSAQVTARTDLRAPNLDAGGSPDKSWKQIGFVEAGTALTVLGTVPGEKESVYKVALPATGECWVNMSFLRRANAQESAALAASLVPVAPATKPAPAPATASAPATTAVATPDTVPTTTTPAAEIAAPVNAAPAGSAEVATVQPQAQATDSPALVAGSPSIPPLLGQAERKVAPGTRTDSHGEGTIEAAPTRRGTTAAAVAVPVRETPRSTWADLEAQWKAVRAQPQASAELDALRARYLELASNARDGGSIAHMANGRATQLELLMETQVQAREIVAAQNKQDERAKAMYQLVLDIQSRADYTAVGVLNASVVYDGERLPQLYRITDPQTSQTIAYVLPNESLAMGTMVGTLVGVKGGKEFDSALNINVISPQVIELLTVRQNPQVTRTLIQSETTAPAERLADKVVAPVPMPAPTPAASPAASPAAEPAPVREPMDSPAEPEPCPEDLPPGFAPDVPPTTTP